MAKQSHLGGALSQEHIAHQVALFSSDLFLFCLVYIQTSAPLTMPSFLKLRTSKTFPPVSEPFCCPSGWQAAPSEGSKTYPT